MHLFYAPILCIYSMHVFYACIRCMYSNLCRPPWNNLCFRRNYVSCSCFFVWCRVTIYISLCSFYCNYNSHDEGDIAQWCGVLCCVATLINIFTTVAFACVCSSSAKRVFYGVANGVLICCILGSVCVLCLCLSLVCPFFYGCLFVHRHDRRTVDCFLVCFIVYCFLCLQLSPDCFFLAGLVF